MEIKDIKGYHKNPRKITEKMFNLLSETIKEYGDLSGIVLNIRTGEVIGGNQRTQFFKRNDSDVKIHTTPVKDSKVGTVAVGYVIFQGEKYNYREVDWDEKKSELANIVANKVGGFWDNDILANEFEIDDLKMAGFEEFELGMFNNEVEIDTNNMSDSMDSYLDGNIKQIVIYFTNEQFQEVIPRMEKIMLELGVENHTEAVLKLMEFYENNRDNKKP